jgi:hypothetical protein
VSVISDVEQAERLSRKLAQMLPFLVIIYISQQATFFGGDAPPGVRSVDHVKIGAWLVLSLVLLLALATNGYWFHRPEIRALMNDEVTQANRSQAMTMGFIFAMAGAMGLYFFNQFEPFTAREAIHIIL